MAVCLGWLLAFPVLALDINETLPNVRILAVYPGNVVVLSRGLEDDVTIGTHAKLRASEGYAARALCVKSGLITSHWRIYRIVEAQLISKDLTYSLIGMDASEVPKSVENWQRIDHEKIVPAFNDDFLKDPQKAPADLAKSDLPDDLKDDEKNLAPKTFGEKIVVRNFDTKKLRRDFKTINGVVQISPWNQMEGGETKGENLGYGFSLGNKGVKYQSKIFFRRAQFNIKDGETGVKSRFETTDARAIFVVKNFSDTTEALSELTFRQARYGRVATPQRQFLVAPVGIAWNFPVGGKTLKNATLSYAPTYDTRTHEVLEDDGDISTKDKRALRHSLRLYLGVNLTKVLELGAELDWRPAQDLTTWSVDFSDNLAVLNLQMQVNLSESLSIVYENQWLDDAQLHRLNQMPRVVRTSSFNLRYSF